MHLLDVCSLTNLADSCFVITSGQEDLDESSHLRGWLIFHGKKFNVTLNWREADKPVGVVTSVLAVAFFAVQLNVKLYLLGGTNVHPQLIHVSLISDESAR